MLLWFKNVFERSLKSYCSWPNVSTLQSNVFIMGDRCEKTLVSNYVWFITWSRWDRIPLSYWVKRKTNWRVVKFPPNKKTQQLLYNNTHLTPTKLDKTNRSCGPMVLKDANINKFNKASQINKFIGKWNSFYDINSLQNIIISRVIFWNIVFASSLAVKPIARVQKTVELRWKFV